MEKSLENVQVEALLLDHLESNHPVKDAAALEKFRSEGLPDIKNENWKYTNIRGFLRSLSLQEQKNFDSTSIDPDIPFNPEDFYKLVLVNGKVVDITFPAGIKVEMLTELEGSSDEALTNLNLAFSDRILKLTISENIDLPVLIYHFLEPAETTLLQTRIHISLEKNASLHIYNIQHKSGDIDFFHNQWVELNLAENSHLDFYRLQEEQQGFNQFSNISGNCERNSALKIFTATLGGGMIRNNYHIQLNGEGAHTGLSGLNVLAGKSHADSSIEVVHNAPNCTSDQLFRNIVNDQSKIVFNGKIFVARAAQKTNAFQSNRSIILSDQANAYAKPQLEIYADDVKCSHGATTGKLDEDALFYLRARGISKKTARTLLLEAFLMDVINNLDEGPWTDDMKIRLLSRL